MVGITVLHLLDSWMTIKRWIARNAKLRKSSEVETRQLAWYRVLVKQNHCRLQVSHHKQKADPTIRQNESLLWVGGGNCDEIVMK